MKRRSSNVGLIFEQRWQ